MDSVSLKNARKRLGALVQAAERGETVVISRRGRDAVKLVPVRGECPKQLPDLSDHRASIALKGKSLSQTVIEMRDEDRY